MKKLYGLVGHPLSHSFSQGFFREKFEIEHIDADYLNFDISSITHFTSLIDRFPEIAGLNVTIPYKEKVIDFIDCLDSEAENIGAVNVVKVINENGKKILKGYNSDIIGFSESIRPLLKEKHKAALILGTGGASKAVFYALKKLGLKCTFVSRNADPEKNILSYSDLSKELFSEYSVIVNTTPLGMYPNTESFPDIPYELMDENYLCYDLVYNPEITEFMKRSANKGAVTKNGYDMLVLQALAAWEIWNK